MSCGLLWWRPLIKGQTKSDSSSSLIIMRYNLVKEPPLICFILSMNHRQKHTNTTNSVCVFLHNYVSLVFLRFRLVTFILCGLWTHRWPHHWHHQVTGSFFIIHPVPQGPAGVDQAPAGLKTASHCDLWPSSSSSWSSWSCFCFSLWTKCVCIFLNAHTNVPILRSSPLKSILLLQGVLTFLWSLEWTSKEHTSRGPVRSCPLGHQSVVHTHCYCSTSIPRDAVSQRCPSGDHKYDTASLLLTSTNQFYKNTVCNVLCGQMMRVPF